MCDNSRSSTSEDFYGKANNDPTSSSKMSTKRKQSFDEPSTSSAVQEPTEPFQLQISDPASSDPPDESSSSSTNRNFGPIYECQIITNSDADSVVSTSSASKESRRRKRRVLSRLSSNESPHRRLSESSFSSEILQHGRSFTNDYQLFRNIRKQVEERRNRLFLVRPIPPHDFKNYLMTRRTYILAGKVSSLPNIVYPPTLPSQMEELYKQQETDRYKLRVQHIIQQEKFVISVEQQILREHGKAARVLTDQYLPFSVCTILRDEEIYNSITLEQENRERKTGLAYSNSLFLKWLKTIDDKSEKVKDQLMSRQNYEAEALYAVQIMDWEMRLRELKLWKETTFVVDPMHVPMV